MNMKSEIEKRHRRQFVKTVAGAGLVGTGLLGGGLLPVTSALAQGQGYRVINNPIATRDESRVEVLEFFWFGCPHCFAFEPSINQWKAGKPEYVDFVREAPPLNPAWENHSRTFYAAEALGITDGMFDQLFDRIHKERHPMRDPKKIGKWIESLDLGVSSEKFQKAMTSFAVETGMKRAMSLAQQAAVTGVPSIVINGKYMTGNSIAGSHQGIINVIDRLTEVEHKAS